MLSIDLSGKRAFVAGVADDAGFGFAIAKALAEAGATVCVGTWPPALGIFQTLLRRGKLDESLALSGGGKLEFERILPLDAEYDAMDDVPADVRENKRYKEHGDFTLQGAADQLRADFGAPCLDVVVHSLANGSEVSHDLLATSRRGYLGAVSVSAYSMVAMVQRFGPAGAPRRRVPEPVVPRRRARHPRLRRRHVERQGRARERHARPRVGGGSQVGPPRQLHQRRPARVARGERHRHATRAAEAPARPKGKPFIEQMVDYAAATPPCPRRSRRARSATSPRSCARRSRAAITGCVIHVDKGYHAMGKAVTP